MVRNRLHRFNAQGLEGLEEAPRSGRPVTYQPEVVSEIIQTALSHPRDLGEDNATWTLDPSRIPTSFARISPAPGTTIVRPIGTATTAGAPPPRPVPTIARSGAGPPVTDSASSCGEPAAPPGPVVGVDVGVDVALGVDDALLEDASAWNQA